MVRAGGPKGRAKVEVLTGEEASEARLRGARRPRLLHLYTHGFYLTAPSAKGGAGRANSSTVEARHRQILAQLRSDPMRRSGVALAGANRAASLSSGPRAEAPLARQDDDGILTAEEAATLDLASTELVVLGACQTGVGEPRSVQGVYGLRRALLYAGAESLLVSLWKVPEKQTRQLLRAFYRNLAAGRSRGEALRRSKARVRKRHPLPYYWAGFILIGDPSSMD
jgi:CHAT domain-containing protein